MFYTEQIATVEEISHSCIRSDFYINLNGHGVCMQLSLQENLASNRISNIILQKTEVS